MRKSKHSEHAIIKSIKQSESGIPVKDICRELGISTALFYQWRSKYSGMCVASATMVPNDLIH